MLHRNDPMARDFRNLEVFHRADALLVEGAQRTTTKEYGRFVEIAAGSAAETCYLLSIASRRASEGGRLGHLASEYERLVGRLHVLRRRLATLAANEDRPLSSQRPR